MENKIPTELSDQQPECEQSQLDNNVIEVEVNLQLQPDISEKIDHDHGHDEVQIMDQQTEDEDSPVVSQKSRELNQPTDERDNSVSNFFFNDDDNNDSDQDDENDCDKASTSTVNTSEDSLHSPTSNSNGKLTEFDELQTIKRENTVGDSQFSIQWNSQTRDQFDRLMDNSAKFDLNLNNRQPYYNGLTDSTMGESHSYRDRNRTLVAYSDSELEDSESDSEYSEAVQDSVESGTDYDYDYGTDDERDNDTDSDSEKKKRRDKKNADRRLRTLGEVFPEELPPLDYLSISADEDIVLEQIGTVHGIVDVLVVIKAVDMSPALFDDTVLFLENRQPLGLIFETLGTVEKPFYSVRFNSNKDVVNRNIKIGDKVMYAPKVSNLTKYVFLAELRKAKIDDASGLADNEAPPEELFYSDDEEERIALKRAKWKEIISRRKEERDKKGEGGKKKRRSLKKAKEKGGETPKGSGLLKGHMNRNPFGKEIQTEKAGLNKKKSLTSFVMTTKRGDNSGNPWRPPVPGAMFGGKPSWQEQPGLFGPRPKASFPFTMTPPPSLPPPSFQPSLNCNPNPSAVSSCGVRSPFAGPGSFPNTLPTFNSSIPPPPLTFTNQFPTRPLGFGPPPRMFSSFNFSPRPPR